MQSEEPHRISASISDTLGESSCLEAPPVGGSVEDSRGTTDNSQTQQMQASETEITASKELMMHLKKNGKDSANDGFLGHVGGTTISSALCFLHD